MKVCETPVLTHAPPRWVAKLGTDAVAYLCVKGALRVLGKPPGDVVRVEFHDRERARTVPIRFALDDWGYPCWTRGKVVAPRGEMCPGLEDLLLPHLPPSPKVRKLWVRWVKA